MCFDYVSVQQMRTKKRSLFCSIISYFPLNERETANYTATGIKTGFEDVRVDAIPAMVRFTSGFSIPVLSSSCVSSTSKSRDIGPIQAYYYTPPIPSYPETF